MAQHKHLYAIHYAPRAIPGATTADYLRDYYLNNSTAARAPRWVFYRQNAAGQITVNEYAAGGRTTRLLATLENALPVELDSETGTVRFKV